MMKKHLRGKTAGARRHAVAASFLVSTAAGILSVTAHAEQAVSTQPPPRLAMTQVSGAADGIAPAKVQTIETAPSLRPPEIAMAHEKAGVAGAVSNAVPAETRPTTILSQGQGEDAVWVLTPDTRPWALSYTAISPLNGLYINLPSEKEARRMLPGYAADAAERARLTVSRYITDNIGTAALARSQQLQTLNAWVSNVNNQKRLLTTDPWAIYQFNKEALATMTQYKAKIQAQTAPTIQRMVADVTNAVNQISPIMAASGAYEQQLQWYNVLVQLKEGMALYQTRVTESDQQILQVISAFEADNPPVARPEGKVPPRPGIPGARPQLTPDTPTAAELTPAAQRLPAAEPQKAKEPGSSVSGVVILLALGAAVVGFFLKLRNRIAGKGKPKKEA